VVPVLIGIAGALLPARAMVAFFVAATFF